MLTSLLRRTLRLCSTTVVERPFTPSLWTTMTIAQLQRLPDDEQLQGVLHAVGLMEGGITAFDYDFYQWSCRRVVEQQQQLTKDDIATMMRLAARHRIVVEPFQKHIENELFLRIHRDYEGDLQLYDENIKTQMQTLIGDLEKQSRDYFSLLSEEEGEEKDEASANEQKQSEDQGEVVPKGNGESNQTQQFIVQMNKKLAKRMQSKEFSVCDLVEVMGLLRATGSKNLPLLQYILQLLTVQYQTGQLVSPTEMLQYVSGLTYVCQHLMAEYSGNRQRYTPRSVKRIYKFQAFYFHEHLRQLEGTCRHLSQAQIEQLAGTYAAFPLKRREIRRRIGAILGEEVKRRELQQEMGLVRALIDINGKDEKMKKSFCEMMGLDLENAKSIGLYQQKVQKLSEKEGMKEETVKEEVEKKEAESTGQGEQKM